MLSSLLPPFDADFDPFAPLPRSHQTSANGPNWIQYLTTTYNVSSPVLRYNIAAGGATVDSAVIPPFSASVKSIKGTSVSWLGYGDRSEADPSPVSIPPSHLLAAACMTGTGTPTDQVDRFVSYAESGATWDQQRALCSVWIGTNE